MSKEIIFIRIPRPSVIGIRPKIIKVSLFNKAEFILFAERAGGIILTPDS
ncbi:hypothetical protein [Nostoc sp. FACHB-133]|nr:hypothetical protein [Nostoc sp. FACHB-133]MBD2526940.1 hypothetical protein [Nostoc sp. FACHB-133]